MGIYKFRYLLFGYAMTVSVIVVLCTLLLYCYYGPLTPNGNMYWHEFDPSTINGWLAGFSIVAMSVFLFPYIRIRRSYHSGLFQAGIFPAKGKFAKVISAILTVMSLGSSLLFAVALLGATYYYVVETKRIMVDNYETFFLFFAYFLCVLFWGIINVIYGFRYKLLLKKN